MCGSMLINEYAGRIHTCRKGFTHACRKGSHMQEGVHACRKGSHMQEGVHACRKGSHMQEGVHACSNDTSEWIFFFFQGQPRLTVKRCGTG